MKLKAQLTDVAVEMQSADDNDSDDGKPAGAPLNNTVPAGAAKYVALTLETMRVQVSSNPTAAGEVQDIEMVRARKLAVSVPGPFTVTLVDAAVEFETTRHDEPKTQVELQELKVYPRIALAEIGVPVDPASYQVPEEGAVVPAPLGLTANWTSYCGLKVPVTVVGPLREKPDDGLGAGVVRTNCSLALELEIGEVKVYAIVVPESM